MQTMALRAKGIDMLSQYQIADDVAENAAFERGDVGDNTLTETNDTVKAMELLPVGSVIIGCGDQPYVKNSEGIWEECEQD